MLLSDFQILRPPHESLQEETLEWFVEAHVAAERGDGAFRERIREKIWHVACKPDRITKRGHVVDDYFHRDWNKMQVYQLDQSPTGNDLSVRSKIFEEYVTQVFESFYPEGASAPADMIHVSCTGYVSPSGAQKIVSLRNWGAKTTVTHAYHMGCYGSIPALRMAQGFLAASPEKPRADIVHTEICSLHSNPADHNLDQLVSQSLFADGFIKYSMTRTAQGPHLRARVLSEETIPASTKAMTWNVASWGFRLSLAKEVPVLIARSLLPFLERLAAKGKIPLQDLLSKALFAVHPGGPKILTHVQDLLKLSDAQMAYSFAILKDYGNMSSATLPHVWERIIHDPAVPNHTPIVSLAFGPGLSIAGALMEKVCGS